jgi:hypothetical protein
MNANVKPKYSQRKGKQRVTRALLGTPLGPTNSPFLQSAAQNIAIFLDLEACPATVIWPSFGNTQVTVTTLVQSQPRENARTDILRRL